MKIKLGIDIGNYDTKSSNTCSASSYSTYTIKNLMLDEYIYYDGLYYALNNVRDNQQIDKTENNYSLIMTLFAVAKEIIFQIRSKYPNISDEKAQDIINDIDEISLGVGLPAGFLSKYAPKLKQFYFDSWGNGLSFEYMNFKFSLKLVACEVLPQDFTAVAFNNSISIVKDFSSYIICGIGGGTVDIIPVENSKPEIEKMITLQKGTTVMYAEICKIMQHEIGSNMDYNSIESVLMNRPNVIDDARKKRIKELADEYTTKLIDEIEHQGIKLSDYPTVFIGGGALLLRNSLEDSKRFAKFEFIDDVNANAKYFTAFAS